MATGAVGSHIPKRGELYVEMAPLYFTAFPLWSERRAWGNVFITLPSLLKNL